MDPHRPSSDALAWRDRVTPVGLVALALLVQWPLFDRTIVPMDEGHLAAAADWMLDGKRLYVDIHTGIFPGVYLITSGLFSVFGRDVIVTRTAAVVMNVFTVLALWWIARRVVDRRWAIAPSLLHIALIAFAFPVMSMFNYSTLALCFGLLGLVFLLRYLERGRPMDGVWLGLLVAASALTKQNFGGLVFLALWIGLAWGQRSSALASRSHVSALLPIGLAGAALTLVVGAVFAAQGALAALIESTLVSLGGSQLSDFDNPIPPIFGPHPDDLRFVFLYTPPALFNALVHGEAFAGLPVGSLLRGAATRLSYALPIAVLFAGAVMLARSVGRPATRRRNATRAVLVFALVFSLGIFPSAIWSHLAFVLPPIGLLVALLADRIERRLAGSAERRGGWARSMAWRVGVAASALGLVFVTVDVVRSVVRWNPLALDLERASVRVSARDRALYQGAVLFVEQCARPGEPILALPDIPIVYFLTDRDNPSPYDLTIPGNVDGALMVRRMRSEGVRCVVMNPRMYPEFPPFKQLFPRLARTLEREFRGERVIAGDAGGGVKWIGLVRRDEGG